MWQMVDAIAAASRSAERLIVLDAGDLGGSSWWVGARGKCEGEGWSFVWRSGFHQHFAEHGQNGFAPPLRSEDLANKSRLPQQKSELKAKKAAKKRYENSAKNLSVRVRKARQRLQLPCTAHTRIRCKSQRSRRFSERLVTVRRTQPPPRARFCRTPRDHPLLSTTIASLPQIFGPFATILRSQTKLHRAGPEARSTWR